MIVCPYLSFRYSSDKQYLTTLLFSIFLGYVCIVDPFLIMFYICSILAVDRFVLGYSYAAAKLLTLGGLCVWWIVDIFLLTTETMLPADGSLYSPYW